jgi:hypothetical protein
MKCPHCGHPDRLHAGPSAQTVDPGTCNCHPPDTPCSCPGWSYWLAQDEWQQELRMEQDRVDRAFGRSLETLYEPDD